MNIEAWHVSILVMTGIIAAEFVVNAVVKKVASTPDDDGQPGARIAAWFKKNGRTFALGLLAALTVVVAVITLGPSLADQLASVAAAVAALVAIWLTQQAHKNAPKDDAGGVPPSPGGQAQASAAPAGEASRESAAAVGPQRDGAAADQRGSQQTP